MGCAYTFSDAVDAGNALTRFYEMRTFCTDCGGAIITEYFIDAERCARCDAEIKHQIKYAEWFESEFEHDPLLWSRNRSVFLICYAHYLFCRINLKSTDEQ